MKIFLFLFLLLPAFAMEDRIALLREPTPIQDKVIEGLSNLLEQDKEIRIWSVTDESVLSLDEEIDSFQPSLVITLGNTPLAYARANFPDTPRVAGMVLKRRDIQHSDVETGVYLEFDPDLQLAWIRKILPDTKVIGMLYSPTENKELVGRMELAAKERDFKLIALEISSPRDIPKSFRQLEGSIDVLLGVFDSVVLTRESARPFISFGFQQKLPFMSVSQSWAKAGALLAMDRDYLDYGKQIGNMAQHILSGQSLRKIEPQDPEKALIFFNQRTADLIKVAPSTDSLEGVNTFSP